METIAELHRRALTSVQALCNNTGHPLEPAMRSHRLGAVLNDVQKLIDSEAWDADPEKQRCAHEAAANVLGALARCFEQNGWDWSELGDLADVSRRYLH